MKSIKMNTSKGENTNVQLKIPSEILIEPDDPRRTPNVELQVLARQIQRISRKTPIRFAYYKPEAGKYKVTWAEIIHIWLPRITDAIEAELIMEIIKIAAKWARRRIRKGSKSPKYINIYSADGKILREIKIKEEEQNPDIIILEGTRTGTRNKPPLREAPLSGIKYAFLFIRTLIKNSLTAIPRRLKYWPAARRIKKYKKAKQHALQLQKKAIKAVRINHKLMELALAKILENYKNTNVRLKQNAVYGKINDTVHFQVVLETDDGTIDRLVHIYCAKEGNIGKETRLYAEALIEFQFKLESYLRLENSRRPLVTYVLVVPRKELGKYPDVDMTAFNSVFGYEKWVFDYKDVGYKDDVA